MIVIVQRLNNINTAGLTSCYHSKCAGYATSLAKGTKSCSEKQDFMSRNSIISPELGFEYALYFSKMSNPELPSMCLHRKVSDQKRRTGAFTTQPQP